MIRQADLPVEVQLNLQRACRLEWWTLAFLASIVVVMYFVLGSSQAMKSAWLEDMLSLLPPVLFIVATKIERREPTERYPYGFHRAGSLAFFASACALTVMGGILLYQAIVTLVAAEHPTIGNVRILEHQIWLGWLMIAALLYSVVPPVIIGRMKKRLARDLRDKVLWTDASMNAADWKTGLAGILGITGIAFGIWWADAIAAGLISFSILRDGVRSAGVATAELLDGAPRELEGSQISNEAQELRARIRQSNPGANVRLRETGRYMRAVIVPTDHKPIGWDREKEPILGASWRIVEISRAVDEL